jgi:mono/diheme cytochrome c family protein
MKTVTALAVVTMLVSASAVRGAAQERGDARRGHDVARQVCAQCHAVEKAITASPHPRAPSFQSIASTPGMTEMGLYMALRTPHGEMPLVVPDLADLDHITAYVRSLRTDE